MLYQIFTQTINNYSNNLGLIKKYWAEIESEYTFKKRFYHTLIHIDNIITELYNVKSMINEWDSVIFSAFYHDIVYDITANNNEEKSAFLARLRLNEISFPKEKTEHCVKMILATKSHNFSPDNDINLFVDADIAILGKSPDTYNIYKDQIRQEYSCYPDSEYNEGRCKVLNHFLSQTIIYKTPTFQEKYEQQARQNLLYELELLQ